MARKNINIKIIKRLYALSGNQCAFPNCTIKITNAENDTNFSEICHIEAAEQGGARYNPNSNDTDRNSFENLILLCPNHHTEIDSPGNISQYTVEMLRKMKKEHENKIQNHERIQKNTSALNTVIKYIGTKMFENFSSEPQNAPDSQEKILYNNITRYKPVIEEYAMYQGKLNKLYKEIENHASPKKELVLQNIKTLYLQEKGKYNNLEEIRTNADNIIDKVKDKLWDVIENSSNAIDDLDYEAIDISLLIILADAFMRCNILEEPPKNDSK
jgi:hypothetical protein